MRRMRKNSIVPALSALSIAAVVGVVLAGNSAAFAARCQGITPEARILYCDDFDNYCTGGAAWPGYPPLPATTCATDGTAVIDNTNFYANWVRVTSLDNEPEGLYPPGFYWIDPIEINADLSKGENGGPQRVMAYDLPFTMRLRGAHDGTYENPPSGQPCHRTTSRHVASLVNAIHAKDPTKDVVNGTDANPLRLKYYMNHYTEEDMEEMGGDMGNSIAYIELTLGDDYAPMDFVYKQCNPDNESPAKYPVVCQQRANITGTPLNAICPPLSTQIHASLAIGCNALMEEASSGNNPCDVENGRRPTNYHIAVFDGLKWHDLRRNLFPGGGTGGPKPGNFSVSSGKQSWVTMEVRTSTFYVTSYVERMDSTAGLVQETSWCTIPRQYTGPFNKMSIGPGPACELETDTYQCAEPKDTFKYCGGYYDCGGGVACAQKPNWCWHHTWIDSTVLYDGNLATTIGACCAADATCTETSQGACVGNFQGAGTTCASTVCCPIPFADADHDGDVDQDDFGAFQICYSGSGAVPTGCSCFDRDKDNNVDSDDFGEFTDCWSGPNVPWSAAITPSCTP